VAAQEHVVAAQHALALPGRVAVRLRTHAA
jgi:hypothetical protein